MMISFKHDDEGDENNDDGDNDDGDNDDGTQVREGDSAILTCRAGSGNPTPDVQVHRHHDYLDDDYVVGYDIDNHDDHMGLMQTSCRDCLHEIQICIPTIMIK